MLKIQADDWFTQYHLEYKERLLASITHNSMPRKFEESKFFSNLHLFYSCRISHNPKIESDRNFAISLIQKSVIYHELLAKQENLDITVSLISAVSGKTIPKRSRFFLETVRLFKIIYRNLGSSKINNLVLRLQRNLENASGFSQKLKSLIYRKVNYKVEIEGYIFDKIEVVAFVELMMSLNQVNIAKKILEQTKSLFTQEPDNIWFEHIRFRCDYFSKKEGESVLAQKPYSIFRIVEDLIIPYEVKVEVKTYIVENNIVVSFENKVGVFESELPQENKCLAINNLSLTLKEESILSSQGESRPTTDLFIGPMGRNFINLGSDNLVATKDQKFVPYHGEFAPFLLSSAGIGNYWHALIESLPRLVLLNDAHPIILMGEPSSEIVGLIKLLKPRAEIFAYSSSGAKLSTVVRSTLSVISKEPFWSTERPSFDVSTLLKFQSELLKLFDKMPTEKSEFTADKVFLTRNSTHRRSKIEKLKKLLEDQDFVSINPSELSIAEQAKVFSSARIIVGEVGAAWANLIFCSRGAKIFNLCAEPSAPTPLFGGFAQILDLNFCSIAFPDSWSYDHEIHWNNTPEAFFQSGFYLSDEHVTRATNFILKNSILN